MSINVFQIDSSSKLQYTFDVNMHGRLCQTNMVFDLTLPQSILKNVIIRTAIVSLHFQSCHIAQTTTLLRSLPHGQSQVDFDHIGHLSLVTFFRGYLRTQLTTLLQ